MQDNIITKVQCDILLTQSHLLYFVSSTHRDQILLEDITSVLCKKNSLSVKIKNKKYRVSHFSSLSLSSSSLPFPPFPPFFFPSSSLFLPPFFFLPSISFFPLPPFSSLLLPSE